MPRTLDAVLVTGDLADHGLPAEYEQVATRCSCASTTAGGGVAAQMIDGIRLTNPEVLAGLIRCPHNIVAILCGHVHIAASSMLAGWPAPGVVATLPLPSPRTTACSPEPG